MTIEGRNEEREPVAEAGSSRPAPSGTRQRRRAKDVVVALWHQKPGPRVTKDPVPATRTEKQVVDGLDQWELRLAIAATVLEAAITPIVYWYWRSHGDAAVRSHAYELLLTGVVSTVLLGLGAGLKRRALVGFAAFMTGFAWLTYQDLLLAAAYLFFGGWLLVRVMRKQRQDRAAGRPVEGIGPRRARATPAKHAPASKRYTPPRRAASGRKAGTARTASQGPRR